MTAKQVLQGGFRERHESGPSAKLDYLRRASMTRFLLLPWVLEARKLNFRRAHRCWCRRNGCRFS